MIILFSPLTVACSVTFVFVTFKYYCYLLETYGKVPSAVEKLNKQPVWWNVFVSLTHSTISSALLLLSFYLDPDFLNNLENHHSVISLLATVFSLGYFIHDTLHLLRTNSFRSQLGIMLHHAIMLTTLGKTLQSRKYINSVCIALFCEISSVFLHSRQLIKMTKLYTGTKFFFFVCVANIVVYASIRFSVIIWMYNWLYYNYTEMEMVYKSIYFINLTLMTLVNIGYFFIIMNSDFLSLFQKSKSN